MKFIELSHRICCEKLKNEKPDYKVLISYIIKKIVKPAYSRSGNNYTYISIAYIKLMLL